MTISKLTGTASQHMSARHRKMSLKATATVT